MTKDTKDESCIVPFAGLLGVGAAIYLWNNYIEEIAQGMTGSLEPDYLRFLSYMALVIAFTIGVAIVPMAVAHKLFVRKK